MIARMPERVAQALWDSIIMALLRTIEVQETTGRPGCTGGSDAEKDTPGEASQDR